MLDTVRASFHSYSTVFEAVIGPEVGEKQPCINALHNKGTILMRAHSAMISSFVHCEFVSSMLT